jgi:3-deoxy-D-manno-octulosonic-acid transferase
LFKDGSNLVKKISYGLRFYLFLSFLLDPIYFIYQLISVLRGKENPKRFWERWVTKQIKRPSGKLIWLHAASVGESLSLLPLIEKIIADDPKINILITSTTKTSAEILEKISAPQIIHRMAPYDTFFVSKRFLKYWEPDLAVRVESEIWPRILLELKKNKIPNFLLNARFSKKSIVRIEKQAESASFLFSLFDRIHVQEKSTKEILTKVGIENQKIKVTGSLKDSREILPVDEDIIKQFQTVIGEKKVWLAACTHPGEDEIVLKAHKKIGGLLLIAPRHIERGKQIASLSRSMGFSTQLRSKAANIRAETAVYVADTMGEMGIWYSLSKAAFIGGSLVDKGGHNPVEAVQLNTFILHGPQIYNSEEKYDKLQEVGLCFQVSGEKDIVQQILRLQGSNKKPGLKLNTLIDTQIALKEALSAINFALTHRL